MNPEDAIAIQAMKARLAGTPTPVGAQVASPAGIQAPGVPVPAQNSMPVGDHQLGDMTKKRPPNESDALAKGILPGTAHTDPHVQILSKALLQKLLPYLGQGEPEPLQKPGA